MRVPYTRIVYECEQISPEHYFLRGISVLPIPLVSCGWIFYRKDISNTSDLCISTLCLILIVRNNKLVLLGPFAYICGNWRKGRVCLRGIDG